eukprot:gene9794-10637_t
MSEKERKDQPSQILSYLYIGNKNHAKSMKILQQNNIKYILNCTPKRSDDPENGCPNYYEKDIQKYSIIYKRIPIYDNRGENILPHLDTAYRFIEESRHYGNILVHCHKGISRSVSMVIGYLMRKNELTYEEALNHIQMFRPIAQPNESFEQQLKGYQPSNDNDLLHQFSHSDSKPHSTEVAIGPSMPRSPPSETCNEESKLQQTETKDNNQNTHSKLQTGESDPSQELKIGRSENHVTEEIENEEQSKKRQRLE